MKKTKDVLIMCQYFYPEQVSSALLPYQTAEKMVEDGLSVSVLCGVPIEYKEDDIVKIKKKEIVNGINICRVNYLKLGKKGKLSRLINYFSFIISMMTKVRECKKVKIIIVYSNPPLLPLVALIANKLYKTKIVFVSYDVYPEIAIKLGVLSKTSLVSRVTNRINKKLFQKVSKIVVLSEDMKDFYICRKNVDSEKLAVIENWATEDFSPSSKIKGYKFNLLKNKSDLIITYLGNMGKAQDIQTIIECVKREKIGDQNITFIFAGRGEKKENILMQKDEFKLNNLYVFDYLIKEDLNDLLKISDMFVVSLENDIAGLAVPSKTYSYYQAQKPIIAIMNHKTQIYSEVVSNNVGIGINNMNVDELEQKLLSIVNDKTILEVQRENMKYFSRKYNDKRQIREYVELIKEIMEE